MSTYNVVKIDEIEAVPYLGGNLIPVRYTLGLRAVGVNAWAADEGGQLIPPHAEDSGSEELYVVLRGRATFTGRAAGGSFRNGGPAVSGGSGRPPRQPRTFLLFR